MNELSQTEYWTEIDSIANNLAESAMSECDNDRECAEEKINDYMLHEYIDGHQWVIYNAYNLDVIKHTENEDYYNDNFGGESLSASLNQGGLSTLHCHIAFWSMYADVYEKLESALDEREESQDAA